VIAEGIETNEQYQQLKALGCEYGQGFLFSHPVDDVEALKLLARDTERDEEMLLGIDSPDAEAALTYHM
jgi:EAL domain-containing protein (putative c-di-GMP-specific phosphodiesterase class I)